MIQKICSTCLHMPTSTRDAPCKDCSRFNETNMIDNWSPRFGAVIEVTKVAAKPIPVQVAATPTDVDATLAERGSRYGKFIEHANITQYLKDALRRKMGAKWDALADDQKEALEMICHKLGRIVNGDPDYTDSWVDIAGYAKLVADRLEGVER